MAFRRSVDSPAGEFDRRRFLTGSLASAATLTHASRIFAASEFWNAKDPSTWTDQEIAVLTSNSPWARAVVPNFRSGGDPTDSAGFGSSGKGGVGRRIDSTTITVRWESAQPILDALKAPLAADFEGHYVVSVTNLPFPNVRRAGRRDASTPEDTLDRLQNGATLQAKGRDAAEAGIARRTRIGSFLFGFSKDYLSLGPSDRDIVFTLNTEQLTVKAKFDAKEMSYQGKLAV